MEIIDLFLSMILITIGTLNIVATNAPIITSIFLFVVAFRLLAGTVVRVKKGEF